MVGRGLAVTWAREGVSIFPRWIEVQPHPGGQSHRLLKLLGAGLSNLLQQLDDL